MPPINREYELEIELAHDIDSAFAPTEEQVELNRVAQECAINRQVSALAARLAAAQGDGSDE